MRAAVRRWSSIFLVVCLIGAVAPASASATRGGGTRGVHLVQQIRRAWTKRVVKPIKAVRARNRANALVAKLVEQEPMTTVHKEARWSRGAISRLYGDIVLSVATLLTGISYEVATNSQYSELGIYGGVVGLLTTAFGIDHIATNRARAHQARIDTVETARKYGHPMLDPTTDEGRENLAVLREGGLLRPTWDPY